jgi:hypothetical protein
MPGRTRSVLLGLEVKPAGKACNCKRNKAHRILKGEARLVVKNAGPASGENGYCATCGEAMLAEAQRRLSELMTTLRGSPPPVKPGA